VALGLGLAVVLANAMRLMFFQVSPYDSATFVAVAVLLLVTGLAAAFIPARRAARVDPMAALRVQ
jgi:ABC-type antimicrobial peptide transport system permease subunit